MRNTFWMLAVAVWVSLGVAACNSTPAGGSGAAADHGKAAAAAAPASPARVVAVAEPGGNVGITAVPAKSADLPRVTLHLAGDSTVSLYPATTEQEGWGQEIGQFFIDKVTVNNQAQGGANVQSFKGSGRWTAILGALKPGDFVMMQFGANDSGTAHGPVTPADFAATLEAMADEVRAKQGTSIFVTPSAFYQFSGGKQDNARLAPYAAACYTAGAAKNVLVDDLNARGVEYLNTIGQTAATAMYLPVRGAPDKAHFVKLGATKMAQMVAEELRRIKRPLAEYLK